MSVLGGGDIYDGSDAAGSDAARPSDGTGLAPPHAKPHVAFEGTRPDET